MKVICAIAILIVVANSQLVDPDPDPSYVPEGNGGNGEETINETRVQQQPGRGGADTQFR
jgi:hypothetical protein